uniref:Gypsy retrotransposon integrase-like protein 1 n=1 Tax=Xenopus tropicalis TaxID=8364 RepID=A0A803JPU4_XENTR
MRFNFHLTYRPGSKNTKADALSRMFPSEADSDSTSETILQPHHFLCVQFSLIDQIKQECNRNTPSEPDLVARNGLFFFREKIFVPKKLRLEVVRTVHDAKLAGHPGIKKTIVLAKRFFWWSNLYSDCVAYVKSCDICSRTKNTRSKPVGLLVPLPVPARPWGSISMDFTTDLPPSKGYNTIFVIIDRLTKMAHFVPLPKLPSAATTAETFIKEIIRLHGLPDEVVSDRGTQFTSKFWRVLCKALQIKISFSSAFHPQSSGQTERTNKTLEQYLRCFTSYLQDDWLSLLPLAEFTYNNAHHSS